MFHIRTGTGTGAIASFASVLSTTVTMMMMMMMMMTGLLFSSSYVDGATTPAIADDVLYTHMVSSNDFVGNTVNIYYRLENLSTDKLPTQWGGTSQNGVNAISMKLIVQGSNQQWLGLGLSPNGNMVGGEVVLGDVTRGVDLYGPMISQSGAGVQLSNVQASIIESSFEQDTDQEITTLSFTRTLDGSDLTFDLSTQQILIWAASTNAFPSYHGTGRNDVTINWTTATFPTNETLLPSEELAAAAEETEAVPSKEFSAEDNILYTDMTTSRDFLGNEVQIYYRLENLSSGKLPTQWGASQDGVNAVSMKLIIQGSNQQWLGLGLSPNGQMVGGEVVLGDVTNGINLYGPMTSQSGAGVQLSNVQGSIIESNFVQDTTKDVTTLRYTRTLDGSSLEFDLSTQQIFIWGASTNSFPSYHGTGRDDITIDWTTVTKPTGETLLPSEEIALATGGGGDGNNNNNEEEEDNNLVEEEEEQAEEEVEEEEQVEVVGEEEEDTGDGFSTPIEIDPNLTMQQRLVNSQTGLTSDETTADAIEFILTYQGSGWLALGVNPAGRSMPGSQVILGKPLEANVNGQNPAKYTISGYSPNTIVLAQQQTLINATIVESNGITTMRFVKLLVEDNEHEIFVNGDNNFVHAIGTSASFPTIHLLGGRQQFQLNPSLAIEEQTPPPATSTKNPARIFIAHGIMALVAWAFFAPIAAAASSLRDFFPQGPIWFQMHRGLNVMTVLVTIVAFITAVAFGGPRFNNPHYIAGWVIFFGALLQASLGIFRPHVNPDAKNGFKGWFEQIKLGSKRAYWELAHKCLGYGLLAITMWQMYTGLILLNVRYQTPNYTTAYWSYMIAFWGIVIICEIIIELCDCSSKKDKKDNDDDDEKEEEKV